MVHPESAKTGELVNITFAKTNFEMLLLLALITTGMCSYNNNKDPLVHSGISVASIIGAIKSSSGQTLLEGCQDTFSLHGTLSRSMLLL